jgi:hypothetical protein
MLVPAVDRTVGDGVGAGVGVGWDENRLQPVRKMANTAARPAISVLDGVIVAEL